MEVYESLVCSFLILAKLVLQGSKILVCGSELLKQGVQICIRTLIFSLIVNMRLGLTEAGTSERNSARYTNTN